MGHMAAAVRVKPRCRRRVAVGGPSPSAAPPDTRDPRADARENERPRSGCWAGVYTGETASRHEVTMYRYMSPRIHEGASELQDPIHVHTTSSS